MNKLIASILIMAAISLGASCCRHVAEHPDREPMMEAQPPKDHPAH